MKKFLSFSEYKAIQKMSLNNLNRWVTSIYGSGFQDGLEEGEKELNDCVSFDEEGFYDFLLAIPGIGIKTADKIVTAIMEADSDTERLGRQEPDLHSDL